MSSAGAASRAAVSTPSAPTPAAAPKSSARAEASRRNGAKSRGPKTPEGKARSARNALKHGMRAQKYVVLPQEDGAEFAALETALLAELAPVGARRSVGHRNGVGTPFPNPAANRPRCSRSAATTAPAPGSP